MYGSWSHAWVGMGAHGRAWPPVVWNSVFFRTPTARMRKTLQQLLGLSAIGADLGTEGTEGPNGGEAPTTAMDRRMDDVIGWVLGRLKQHPEFRALLRQEASQLLEELARDAAVQTLVRAQADAYLEYLRENPEQIQSLVRQQSQGAAAGILDILRVRAALADDAAHGWSRRLRRARPSPTTGKQAP